MTLPRLRLHRHYSPNKAHRLFLDSIRVLSEVTMALEMARSATAVVNEITAITIVTAIATIVMPVIEDLLGLVLVLVLASHNHSRNLRVNSNSSKV